jgi:YidC/Oxa1 family membrane protein insertase
MENRALLAVVISLLILLAYQAFVLPYFYPNAPDGWTSPPDAETGSDAPIADSGDDSPLEPKPQKAAELADVPAAPERIVTVDTDHFIAELTSHGGRLKSFRLKEYRATVKPDSPLLDLVLPTEDGELPFGLELRGRRGTPAEPTAGGQPEIVSVSDLRAAYGVEGPQSVQLTGPQTSRIEMTWTGAAGTVRKAFEFTGDQYGFVVSVSVADPPSSYREVGVTWEVPRNGRAPGGSELLFDRAEYLNGKKFVYETFDSGSLATGLLVQGSEAEPVDLKWVGIAGQHFIAALIPLDADDPRVWLKDRDRVVEAKLLFPLAGATTTNRLGIYVGAKEMKPLTAMDHDLARSIDLGYFSFVGFPLLWALRRLHTFTHNYGLDIILLTVLIKVLFWPLTQKSFQTMRAMQKLQPQMAKLREQYKDDQEALNKEMIELYRRHKVNPFGGCLPMILQLPVFIGLYQALMNAVELRHSPFLLWIDDLSAPDRLGSLPLPFIEPPGIPVLTVLMGASMLAQQWMSPPAGDPAQQRVMMLMPLLFTFVFVNFPSGLVLYWLVNNLLTIAQQWWITRSATPARA